MNELTTRVDRLERRAGIGEPLKLTVTFYDSVLNGTISDEEFARYAPALSEIIPRADLRGMPLAVIDSVPSSGPEEPGGRRR